jgi:hypothetical protein
MGEQEPGTEGAATEVRCASCGAIPAAATTPATSTAGADTPTETHCEWCGAEYPVPGAR